MLSLKRDALKRSAAAMGLATVSEDSANQYSIVHESTPAPSQLNLTLDECSLLKSSIFPIQEQFLNNDLTFQTYYAPPGSQTAPIFICHHGAGSSAMTFWCAARSLISAKEKPGVFLYDARGHGNSTLSKQLDYALSDFTADLEFVMSRFLAKYQPQNPLCLIGHSLGGAVMTNYISSKSVPGSVKGLVVIDIVEEAAIRALDKALAFVKRRPKSFTSLMQAVQWHLQSSILRNEESAKVSVPDLLTPVDNVYMWRADLERMSKYWHSWFVDLSLTFVTCNSAAKNVAKLLLLSTSETLDKELMIGQMQGKYQLVVFNNSLMTGHFIQEDIPQQFGCAVLELMRRNSEDFSSDKPKFVPTWGGKINS